MSSYESDIPQGRRGRNLDNAASGHSDGLSENFDSSVQRCSVLTVPRRRSIFSAGQPSSALNEAVESVGEKEIYGSP